MIKPRKKVLKRKTVLKKIQAVPKLKRPKKYNLVVGKAMKARKPLAFFI